MKHTTAKTFSSTKKVKDVDASEEVKKSSESRIDEESLFNLFTANIMKMKKKFIR